MRIQMLITLESSSDVPSKALRDEFVAEVSEIMCGCVIQAEVAKTEKALVVRIEQ